MSKIKAPSEVAVVVSSVFFITITGITILAFFSPVPWYGKLTCVVVDLILLGNIIRCIKHIIDKRRFKSSSKKDKNIEENQEDKTTQVPLNGFEKIEYLKKSSNYNFCNHYLPGIFFKYTSDFEDCYVNDDKLTRNINRILTLMHKEGFDVEPLFRMKPNPKLNSSLNIIGIIMEMPNPTIEPECNFVFFGLFDSKPVYFESELYSDGTFGLCQRDKEMRHFSLGNIDSNIQTVDDMWNAVVSMKK